MRLFLSHASESKPVVERIAAGLPAHVDRWLDKEQMAAGEQFSRRIEDAIAQTCDYMVVFLDDAALSRDWVPREVAWGLEREASLGRTFVIPVLLEDVRERLHEIPQLDKRLYLMAPDQSPAGVARAAAELSEQLFFHASLLVESLRSTARRSLLEAFSRELTAYKQAAFQWRASLGNALDVLTTNPQACEHVRESVRLYNEAADPFIAHLGAHRDRITAAWSRYRGLCDDVRALTERIEQVYRGEMFALNRIHEIVHALMVTDPPQVPAADDQAQRDAVLAHAGAALDELSRRSTQTIAALEREIT
jgi:hypothetical protein